MYEALPARFRGELSMATRDEEERKRLIDQSLRALATESDEYDEAEAREKKRIFAEMAKELDQPGIQDAIIRRYESMGKTLLADTLPSRVDPRIARSLRPMLGDVSDVRVHTGRVASEAARAMDARAFAVGDKDIFFDRAEFEPNSAEGAQLIAHEIAHTRDAATGFALSSRNGTSTSGREAFAHDVEHQFARERIDDEASEVAGGGDGGGSDSTPETQQPKVDKQMLAEKIVGLLSKQEGEYTDRHGHWSRP